MLHRIHLVQGVGLFNEARGSALKLEQATLIYAGNGRGKSTLSSIFRSVATNNSSIIQERRTIDGNLEPKVHIQFDSGHKVTYENGAWSEARPEFRIFDTSFIEDNVHSGGEVSTEHRKNLLDFAIGDRAVASRKAEEKAAEEQREATADKRDLEKQLTVYADNKALSVFRALKPVEDAVEMRASLDKRRADALRAETIMAQPTPVKLKLPRLDIPKIFDVLNTTLNDVHVEAEERVSEHIRNLGDPQAASWLSEGQQFDDQVACPYCGQSTVDVPLIRMYQSHFNHSYKQLKNSIAEAIDHVEREISPQVMSGIIEQRSQVNEKLAAWKNYVSLEELSDELDELAQMSINNVRTNLRTLLLDKSLDPSDPCGPSPAHDEVNRLWEQFINLFSDQNDLIEEHLRKIAVFKESLQGESVQQLTDKISQIDLANVRHTDNVAQLFSQLDQAETRLQKAESDKAKARETLDAMMASTLQQYRNDINKYLGNLGAAFTIDEIKTNYLGKAPRTDYGLTLRGQSVKLNGGRPSFATALSEGDKRTLAFAFFVASTLADPDLAARVVVIDDPVSSLDRSRREYTTKLLVDISNKCPQMILLAHDATFLRDAHRALDKGCTSGSISVVQIERAANNYSQFCNIDLDRECETQYYADYRVVDEFVDGGHSDASRAAIALRPLLEGYLHRRFPGKLSSRLMLGQVITEIDDAQPPSPLIHMQPSIGELRELNEFAGQFHHNTNPGYSVHKVDPDAVVAFGRRVLNIVHGAS